tara:strand:- start:460 stop:1266 length:807 start_codon:yes stop_codon:yes gene_type:complete
MARVDTTGGTGFAVDNGTGLQVRTKLQQVIDALRSLQSGSGDPTVGLGAYQLHIDEVSNTEQKLKIRNKANDGFTEIGDVAQTNLGMLLKAGGTMTGALALSAGTVSAPSLNQGDAGTGLYKKGTNQLGLVANQAEIAFLDQDGLTINNQKEIRFSEPTSAATGGSVQYVGIKAPSTLGANLTLTLPNSNPAVAGYALISTDTSGTLSWGVAGGAVGGSTDQVFWENDQTVTTNYAITNNKNAGSFGPITISSGVEVTVGSGETWTVV